MKINGRHVTASKNAITCACTQIRMCVEETKDNYMWAQHCPFFTSIIITSLKVCKQVNAGADMLQSRAFFTEPAVRACYSLRQKDKTLICRVSLAL